MSDYIRVVVVLNHHPGERFGMTTVHGLTSDDAEAQSWVRELIGRYGDPLAATMTVGLIPHTCVAERPTP